MNKTNKFEWGKVDWDNQDVEIARKLGCSREAVRQARVRLKKGESLNPWRRTGNTVVSKLAGMETEGKTLLELAKLVGSEEPYVMSILKELKKGYKRRVKGGGKYDWGKVPINWRELRDVDIAKVVGVKNPAVVAQWRKRHGHIREGEYGIRAKVVGKAVEL